MKITDTSLTIRCASSFKEQLIKYAKDRDLTVSQLIRQHFKKLPARRRKSSTRRAA